MMRAVEDFPLVPGDLQGRVGRLRVVEQLDERLDTGEIGPDPLPRGPR